jgi:hypothetical protein
MICSLIKSFINHINNKKQNENHLRMPPLPEEDNVEINSLKDT